LRVVRIGGRAWSKQYKTTVFNSGSWSAYRMSLKLSKGTYRIYPHISSGGDVAGQFGGPVNLWGDSQQQVYKKVVVR
jgi:hypothetical protein